MITTLKLAGLSALLSAGLVSGFDPTMPEAGPAVAGKIYLDRVAPDGRPSPQPVIATR